MGSRVSESRGSVVPIERIESRILLVRGHKVLLDADLAALYRVETRVINQAVKPNRERFPADFMFRLSAKELEAWRSHFVMSNPGARMGLRRAPSPSLNMARSWQRPCLIRRAPWRQASTFCAPS